jgi:hypothetical protein
MFSDLFMSLNDEWVDVKVSCDVEVSSGKDSRISDRIH